MATDWISARTILWYVTFFGFAVNYMIRINMNIAIVAMIRHRQSRVGQLHSECFTSINESVDLQLTQNISDAGASLDSSEGFDWDEREQGMVLGSFFWMHWITQLPGGILAQRYGGKAIFGYSQLVTCLLCYLIPAAAYHDLYSLLFLRFLQGFIAGFVWPAMHHLTGKWIPPNERSKFVTSYMGSSVGAALTYPICGLLIDAFGWESVFHVTGTLGILWYVSWWLCVYDSPDQHPRISTKERKYIEESLGQTSKNEKLKTPWKPLLLSRPLWMNIIAQWGGIWGLFTMLVQAPTYFKLIHGWDMRATGFLSGLPHLVRMIFAVFFGQLSDYLLRSKKMTRTNVRKLAAAVCDIGQGILTLALAFVGCDSTAAIFLVTAAIGVHGAVSAGPLAAVVDISPNFAGISLGLCGMISAMPGFLSPAIVGMLTLNNQTVGQWQTVFFISSGMLLTCGTLYVLFSDSEVQPWNSPNQRENDEVTERLNAPVRFIAVEAHLTEGTNGEKSVGNVNITET